MKVDEGVTISLGSHGAVLKIKKQSFQMGSTHFLQQNPAFEWLVITALPPTMRKLKDRPPSLSGSLGGFRGYHSELIVQLTLTTPVFNARYLWCRVGFSAVLEIDFKGIDNKERERSDLGGDCSLTCAIAATIGLPRSALTASMNLG